MMTKKDLQQALPRFTEFVRRFGPLLEGDSRVARAEAYLRGLLLDADDNKNAETIALNAYGGDTSQVRMTQHFLGQSPWPYLPLRAELVRWVDEAFGEPEGVLIVDESGVAKCGDKSVGVARQYCGATGKIDNCQVGVFLAYASGQGHTLLDARLYLPEEEWAKDPARRQAAGVPAEVVFRTKPELAAELVLGPGQALRHGWVTFDEGYGKDPGFLSRLEEAGERYLGEVPKSVRVWRQRPVVEGPGRGRTGRPRHKPRVRADQPAPQTVAQVAAGLRVRAWQRLAFREGTKGTQEAEFARLRVVAERDDLPGPEMWLVVERSLDQEPTIKYYLSNATPEVPLLQLVQVGHTRWPVEDCFLQGKQEVGLDAYEVRSWLGWHHHMTLVMLALWFLKLETQRLGEKSGRRYHVA
jgi:SRSO17 transposase